MTKPPIGLMPESIWNYKYPYHSLDDITSRIISLEAVLWRYYEAGYNTCVDGNYSYWRSEFASRRIQAKGLAK